MVPRRILFSLLVAAIFCGTLARFHLACATVPSYVAYDMDLAITVDSLLLGSGRLPDNLGHPGFGMNLLLSRSQALAHAAGWLSTVSVDDLPQALNPLLPAMEVTRFNRAHSPYVAMAVVAFLWAGLSLGLRWPPWLACVGLLALSSAPGLVYQAMGVRSELYALFYWSLGMLGVSLAGRARDNRGVLLWSGAAGFALGLSFLTKVQVIIYLLGAGLYLYYLLWIRRNPPEVYPQRLGVALNASALVILLGSLWGAWVAQPPKGKATFASAFGLTPPALALFGLLATLLIIGWRTRQQQRLLVPTSALLLGFVLSPAAHFLVFRNLSMSWLYMALDLKIVYLRPDYYGGKGFQNLFAYLGRLSTVASNEPALIGGMVVLLSTAIWLHRNDKSTSSLLLSLGGTALLAIAVGTREKELDWAWVELFPTAVLLLSASILAKSRKPAFGWMAGILVLLLAISNLSLASTMARRYRDSQAAYGYRPWRFSRAVFAASFPLYTGPFDRRYEKAGWPAFRASVEQMERLPEILMMADAITGAANPLRLGPAAVGLPVWSAEPQWLIHSVTSTLADALVVDPSLHSDDLQLGIRLDLASFLMVDEAHYTKLVGSPPPLQGERLELRDSSATLVLYPISIDRPVDFAKRDLGPRALILIKPLMSLPNPVLPPEPQW